MRISFDTAYSLLGFKQKDWFTFSAILKLLDIVIEYFGFVIYASIKLYGISPRIDSHLTSLVGVVTPVTWIFGCSRKRARLVRSAWGRWRRRTRRERTFSFRRWTRRSSCCPWCSSSRKDFASLKCPETFGSDKRLDRLYYRTLCIPIMNYNSILNWTVDFDPAFWTGQLILH